MIRTNARQFLSIRKPAFALAALAAFARAAFLLSAVAAVLFLGAVPSRAEAAAWSAEVVGVSSAIVRVEPGQDATFSVTFRNTGTRAWASSGTSFVSIYTHGPQYRQSAFRHPSWYGAVQPTRLVESSVAPGATGTIRFTFRAPVVSGTFTETFHLAAEDTAWIPGGRFNVNIIVAPQGSAGTPPLMQGSSFIPSTPATPAVPPPAPRPVVSAPAPTPAPVVATPASPSPSLVPIFTNAAPGFSAEMLLVSARSLEMTGGTVQTFRVGLKNTGTAPWTNAGERQVRLAAEDGNAFAFRHASWPSANVAAGVPGGTVQPGQLAFFDVQLAAPLDAGEYQLRFALIAGNDRVEGGSVALPVRVFRAATPPPSTSGNIPSFGGAPDPVGERGPNIRVGLFHTREPIVFRADGPYTLIEGRNHTPVRQLSGTTTVTFDFATLMYTVRNGDYVQTFDAHVHLRPVDMARTFLEIPSFNARAEWDQTVNFNVFRGELEVFYSRASGELWVIEELPIEDYMRGLAETSNGSPYEYQKALVTAARTFAYFVQRTGGKHPTKNFDVTASDGDQVYKGYISEAIRPNVVRAVEETRGMIVTLGESVVATPYFSRSDGRTRAFNEVWGGATRSWLVAVPTPYDAGKTLWGHGVGMSASDALARAQAGATWQEILKYYYTGVDITRRY